MSQRIVSFRFCQELVSEQNPNIISCSLVPESHKQWLIPLAIQLVPGVLFVLCIPLFIRESPCWLITRGRREEAIKNLEWLHKLDASDLYILEEINMIDIQGMLIRLFKTLRLANTNRHEPNVIFPTTEVDHDIAAVGAGFWAPIRQVFCQWPLFKRLLITSTLFMW